MNRIATAAFGFGIAMSTALSALTPGPRILERRAALPPDAQDPSAEGLRPLSIAAADFDGDGVADLAAGYAGPGGAGRVVLFRGNPDAIYAWSPEARRHRDEGRLVAEPFLPTGTALALPAPPDLLLAGDFDADGRADLAAIPLGGSAVLFARGDGRGGLEPAPAVAVPGAVTAAAAGEMNRRDGLPDVVVSVAAADGGARALVLAGPEGALRASAAASFDLPASASSIAVGDADGDGLGDFAAVAGAELFLLSGRGNLAAKSSGARVPLDFEPRSVRIDARGAVVLENEDGGTRALVRRASDSGEADWDWAGSAAEPPSDAPLSASIRLRVGGDATPGTVGFAEDGSLAVYAPATVSTFVVDSTADTSDAAPGDGICAASGGACTLRAAIQEANAHAGADAVSFAIPGGGVPQITTPGLPAITETLTIDGTTQPAGKVMVTGTTNGTLITLSADDCVVRGIVLNGTGNFGLKIQSNGNVVEGNFFGTTGDGTALQGGISGPDVIVSAGASNLIGGTAAAARNVIAGGTNGIRLDGGTTAIQGNYVGTDVTGTADLGSTSEGIRVFTADFATIGGTAPGAGNLVSGSGQAGIHLDTDGNLVQGNRVGTDATGTIAIPNGIGVRVNFSVDNTIGGTALGAGNLVSGNLGIGVQLDASGVHPITNTIVQGNRIGTDAAGATALPNQGHGIRVVAGTNVQIGGSTAGARNLISGNLQDGISITKFSTVYPTDTVIQGNDIGTDATGTVPVGNVANGISIEYALGALIGGTGAGEGNVLSGNQQNGIRFVFGDATANPNHVVGNLIGVNALGTGALGNAGAGALFTSGMPGYELGGEAPGEANVIAYNGGAGIAGTGSGDRVRFRPNVVHTNGGLGVDRGNDGVTPNQTPGTFVYQNFPVLTSATTSPSGTVVDGTLGSGYALSYTLYFFANPACDVSGYGEARQYLGSLALDTTAGAQTPFTANLATPAPAGSYITAISVPPDGTTWWGAASELSFCRLVTGDPGPPQNPPPLSLSVVVPAKGGNGGSATVIVTGESIDPAAAVKLQRTGEADIPGEYVVVGAGGGNLRAIFNLTGRTPGAWDLVVTNPDTSSAALTSAFTIENGGEADLYADLIGRSRILRGRDTTFYLVFGNRGAVDAYGAQVILAGIPSDAVVTPLFTLPAIPQYDYLDPFDYTQIPLVAANPDGQSLQLFVPDVPAGSRFTLAVRIKTSAPEFELRAGIGGAWFLTSAGGIAAALNPSVVEDIDPDLLNCILTLMKNMASLFLDLAIPGDCANVVKTVMANHLPNWFGNMLGAGQAEAGTTSAILSSTQASTQLVQIGAKGALCFAEILPASRIVGIVLKLADLAAKAETIAEIAQACGPLLPPWITKPIKTLIPSDPNDKIGSDGVGPEHWVNGGGPATYQILFENKPQATAPAHEVVVTDQLDLTKFDPSSFSFGPVTFGDFAVETPENALEFSTDVDMRPTRDVIARVSGSLDAATGLLTWRFLSLDPATGLPSEDPAQGFLPPNTAPPAGEGTVSFSVGVRSDLTTGAEYRNHATIVFDLEAPIETPEWLNTIDETAPTSSVSALPAQVCSAFTVQWSGSDSHSGVRNYDVYVSENGGAWDLWLAHTSDSSAVYTGAAGNTFAFYSIARDGAGNEEAAPASADATTSVSDPSPIVSALTPTSGPAGGASVALAGDGFLNGLTLTVGGSAASGVSVTDSQNAAATFPALAPGGVYDLVAANPGGCAWSSPGAWLADFLDVDQSHPFHPFVENIVRRSITAGCGGGNYCVNNPVTRAQMAVFLLKTKYGASYAPPAATGTVFGDVPAGSFAADWIEQLATEGITGGCGGGNYCPTSSVTRAQMAVFLLKSAHGPNFAPPAAGGVFGDVPPSDPFAPWVEDLYAEGVTGGCSANPLLYCPSNPVTRGQMAVFLPKMLGF